MTRRFAALMAGFVIWGLAVALLVRAELGLAPWDVFHQGLGFHTGLTIGQAGVATGFVILLLWIPLRVRPGIGTILNVLTIGPAADFFLGVLPPIESEFWRWAFLAFGLLLTGIGSALYLPANLGTGPRDGLMIGLYRRFGLSIRLARTLVEIAALALGWLMGGTVGIGTLVMAFGLGPVVQAMLRLRRRLLGLEREL